MNLRYKFFLSSLSPLFFLLIIQNFSLESFCKMTKKIFGGISTLFNFANHWTFSINSIDLKPAYFFWILIIFAFSSSLIYTFEVISLLTRTKKYKDQFEEKNFFLDRIKKIESLKNIDILNYIFAYMVPMLSLNINKFGSIIANSLLLGIVGFIYIKTNQIYQNPIFLLKNIYVYELNENGKL